jgi:cytochrome P450
MGVEQRVQHELRSALRSAFDNARQPTVQEVVSIGFRIPYLEAVVEEVLRVGGPSPGSSRRVMTDDVHVLGVHLPRDTVVMLMSNGPGIVGPPLKGADVPEQLRSARSQASKGRVGQWDEADIANFKPERWLLRDGDAVLFNANAGPTMPFGVGARACFGRKLAYVQMKILLILVVWNFEIEELGNEELASFEAMDTTTHKPKVCYVKLTPIEALP